MCQGTSSIPETQQTASNTDKLRNRRLHMRLSSNTDAVRAKNSGSEQTVTSKEWGAGLEEGGERLAFALNSALLLELLPTARITLI